MKKSAKKLLALMMALIMLASVTGGIGGALVNVYAEGVAFAPEQKIEDNLMKDEDENPVCGEGWELYADGELVITGNVAADEEGSFPWSGYVSSIKTVSILGDGVTAVSDGAFAEINISSIYIPSSVVSLKAAAFGENLTAVYYQGNEDGWTALETGFVGRVYFSHTHESEAKNVYKGSCKDKEDAYSGDSYCKICGTLEAKGAFADWNTLHTPSEDSELKEAATCNHKYDTFAKKCTVCDAWIIGSEEERPNNDVDHPEDQLVITRSTAKCGEEGAEYSFVCQKCGEGGTKNCPDECVIEAKEEQAATCTEAGFKTTGCKYCDKSDKTEEIPALGHNFNGQEETVKEPDCNERGEKAVICSNEGCSVKEYSDYIPTLHEASAKSYKENETVDKNCYFKVTTAATCTVEGIDTLTCKKCEEPILGENGEPITRNVGTDVTKHTPAEEYEVVVPATCTTDGYEVLYCTECKMELDRKTLPALKHNFVAENEVLCTDGGTIHYVCQNEGCEESYDKVVEQGEHDTYEELKAPTCTEKGYTVEKCRNCTYEKEYNEVPALNHDFSTPDHKDPTCTEPGYDRVVCSRDGCDEVKPDSYVEIAENGHDYYSVTDKAATCEEEGVQHQQCRNCDYVGDPEATPKAPHSNEVIEHKDPTCTEQGYDLVECTVCHKNQHKENIKKELSHDYSTPDHKDPTCTEAGYDRFVCSHDGCDEIDPERITVLPVDPDAHTPKDAVQENVVAATCKKTGSCDEVVYCKDCNEEISRTAKTLPVNPDAHTPKAAVKENIVAATCSKAGTYDLVVYCKDCNKVISRTKEVTPISKNNHPDTNKDGVCDQCKRILREVKINVCKDSSVPYGAYVTVKATADGLPAGYKIKATVGNSVYSDGSAIPLGQVKKAVKISYTIIDSKGEIAKDINGSPITAEKTISTTFISRIIYIFRVLLGRGQREVTLNP